MLALFAASSASAQPASLCGITAATVTGYHAAVAADPRFKRSGGDALRETWSSEVLQAIWTFTTSKMVAHPAAICQQVIDRGGVMLIDRQVVCEASSGACEALTTDFDKTADSSGDGE